MLLPFQKTIQFWNKSNNKPSEHSSFCVMLLSARWRRDFPLNCFNAELHIFGCINEKVAERDKKCCEWGGTSSVGRYLIGSSERHPLKLRYQKQIRTYYTKKHILQLYVIIISACWFFLWYFVTFCKNGDSSSVYTSCNSTKCYFNGNQTSLCSFRLYLIIYLDQI